MALTKTQVSMLYVAIFNRASEGEGNKYWQTNQPDMASTANAMLNTPDAKAYFGSSLDTDQAFIELIYKNTLNKTYSDDKDGIDYWVKELANKSRGEVVAALVNAVADYKDSTDATTKAAYDQFMNRVEVSDYVADKMEKAPDDYKTSLGFDGDLTVTNDASTVTTAESIIDDAVQSANAQKLTVQPDNIHGTNGDDLFDGSVVQNTINGNNVDTFTSSDRIDGGTGNDTLIIQQTGDNTIVSGAVSNIENIKFTAFGDIKYDMSNTTGVTDFLNQNSVAKLTLTGANEMNIGIKNINNKTTHITFDGTVYATTTDSTTLTLENATNQAQVTLNGTNDIETLNIVSKTANNKIDLGGTAINGTTTMVITGDKDLSIDTTDNSNAMTALKTVDASAFTGALDLDLRNSAADVKLNVTGGSGDDKVMIDNFTKDDVLDLGAGKDGLGITLTSSVTTAASLKNIEDIAFRTDTDNLTVNLDGATELERIALELGGETINVTNAASSVTELDFLSLNNKASDTLDDINFRLKDSSGTSDSLTLNIASVDSDARAIQMNDTALLTMAQFTANNVEEITINTANLGKDDTSTDAVEGGLLIKDFNADSVTKLTIVSDTKVDLVGGTTNSTNATHNLSKTITEIDASAANGGVLLDLTEVADLTDSTAPSVTVTTGSGVDNISNINVTTNVTIKTNDGIDTLNIFSAVTDKKTVIIDSGAGNDSIDVSKQTAGDNTDDGVIKITTGDGVDTVKINADVAADGGKGDSYDISISDFTTGVAGDKIAFDANSAGTTYSEIDVGATGGTKGTSVDGLNVVYSTETAPSSLSITNITTFLNTEMNVKAADIMYFVVSDGSDAALVRFDDKSVSANDAIDDGELDILVTLSGISNVKDLHADNFVDFIG